VGALEVDQEQPDVAIVPYGGKVAAAPEHAPSDPKMMQIVPYGSIPLSCAAFATQALYGIHNKLISVKIFCGCTELY